MSIAKRYIATQLLPMVGKSFSLYIGEIAEHFELTKPTLSKHFNVLKEADLIQGIRQGTVINYCLNVSVLEEALWALFNRFNLEGEKK